VIGLERGMWKEEGEGSNLPISLEFPRCAFEALAYHTQTEIA
jgi:hypothetical protein